MKKFFLTLALAAVLGSPVRGGAPLQLAEALSPGPDELQRACGDLRSLTGYELSIDSAVLVPAARGVPEYCLVKGRILPQVQFVLALPGDWNRRLTMTGNGGWAGVIRPATLQRWVKRGDAAVVTDAGHDARLEPGGSFAVDRQKLADFGYRAVHVTALAAKKILTAYYRPALERSYFFGCSQGGRQALMSAQRFPEDFDGIVAGAPLLNYVGQSLAMAWNAGAIESGPLDAARLEILARRVYEKCDGIDGVEDGVIGDPLRCQFDPARELPLCSGGAGTDCFSDSQLRAVKKIYSGPVSNGQVIFPGLPPGIEVSAAGRGGGSLWLHLSVLAERYAEPFFRFAAFEVPDPDYDWRTLDFDSDIARLEWLRPILDATNADLSRFRDRGGKLLMYHGWVDQSLNPLQSVNYYEEVLHRMGPSTSDFYRLYMIPGMLHCGGGAGVNQFERFDPLVDWVENGSPPQQLLGSRIVDGKVSYTRPLCPYPEVARYRGTGSSDDAANWDCVAPPPQ